MVDLEDTTKYNETKEEIEESLSNVLAVIDIKDTASYKTYQGEIDEGKLTLASSPDYSYSLLYYLL